jgi:O-antigen/teichoic acid export membrane protein
LLNRAVMVISPIILARLLSVTQFGHYREFLVYVTLLVSMAAFGINSSLLNFIPTEPTRGWRFVNQAVLMTLASSTLVAAGALLAHFGLDDTLLGAHPVAVVVYVWLFVNFDFWEALLIAEKQPYRVWAYTSGRLVGRLLVVTVAAILTHDVTTIIWSLIGFESLRLLVSLRAWHSRNRTAPRHGLMSWREQLAYCAPFGFGLMLSMFNSWCGSLFVAKMLGPVALAQYTIGVYGQPIINIMRNSLSDVMLGEMAARKSKNNSRSNGDDEVLALFRRTTVMTLMVLVGMGVVLARFAETIVITLFSESYRSAIVLFQLYMLALVRESFDFGILIRAINRSTPIMLSSLVALILNVGMLVLVVPVWGLPGAVIAFVISRVVEGFYLGIQTKQTYGVSWRELVRWADVGKVLAAAGAAASVLFIPVWTGLVGAMAGACVFAALFAVLLRLAGIPEAALLWRHAQSYSRSLLARLQT